MEILNEQLRDRFQFFHRLKSILDVELASKHCTLILIEHRDRMNQQKLELLVLLRIYPNLHIDSEQLKM